MPPAVAWSHDRGSARTRRHEQENPPEETAIDPLTVSPTGLDPQLLDEDAVRSLQRLRAKGFEAYLVGGCVRDLLIGLEPKDFDIATSALPRDMRRVFPRNCRVIGRRFKLAHLHFNGNSKILEAATFRRTPEGVDEDNDEDDLLIVRDNVFGTAEQDAVRRDFTVNALFFDPLDDRIIDYAGGLADIRARVIRTIGHPQVRFREDPVRILRAAKFAGRLGFTIDPPTYAAMKTVAPDLTRAAPPRLLEEILRLLRGGHALESFQILRDVDALPVILPAVGNYLSAADAEERLLFWRTLESLDNRIARGDVPSNPVLLGALFNRALLALAKEAGRSPTTLAEEVIGPFAVDLRLPRRDAGCLKRICGVQSRFTATGRRRFRLSSFLRDAYFPQALELFELSCRASGEGLDRLDRWQRLAAGAESREEPEDQEDQEALEAEEFELQEATDTDGGAGAETQVEFEADETAVDLSGKAPDSGGPPRRSGRRRRRRRRKASPSAGGEPVPKAGAAEAARESDAGDSRRGDGGGGEQGGRRSRRRRRGHARRQGDTAEAEPAKAEPKEGAEKADQPASGGKERKERRAKRERRGRRAKKAKKAEAAEAREPDAGQKRKRGRRRQDVKTVEPEPVDVSAFDLELDPKRVPTFTTIVDGADQAKKRRRPRVSRDETDTYKPPPPPGTGEGDQPPPPPPDDDVFGDW